MNPGRRRVISVLLSVVLIFVQVSGDTFGREEDGDQIVAAGIGTSLSIGDSGVLAILGQPEDTSGSTGDLVTFEIEVNRTDATFQWYRGELDLPDDLDEELSLEELVDAYAQWQPLDGEEGGTLQFYAEDGDIPGWYRCVVTAGEQRAVSRAAGLFMGIMPLANGNIFLDPVYGEDTNDGLSEGSAVKTLDGATGALAKSQDGGTIYLMNPINPTAEIRLQLESQPRVTIVPYEWDSVQKGAMFQISSEDVYLGFMTISAVDPETQVDILPISVSGPNSKGISLKDCKVIGGNRSTNAIRINSGRVVLEGTTISGFKGDAVVNSDRLQLSLGNSGDWTRIEGNGGGVNNTSGATVYIYNGASITNNKTGDKNFNLYIPVGATVQLPSFDSSKSGMIGITAPIGQIATMNTNLDHNVVAGHFYPDDDPEKKKKTIIGETGLLRLALTEALDPAFGEPSPKDLLIPNNKSVSETLSVDVKQLESGEVTAQWEYRGVGVNPTEFTLIKGSEFKINNYPDTDQDGNPAYKFTHTLTMPTNALGLEEGDYEFRVKAFNYDKYVEDEDKQTATAESTPIKVRVFAAPEFKTTQLPPAIQGIPYSAEIEVSGTKPIEVAFNPAYGTFPERNSVSLSESLATHTTTVSDTEDKFTVYVPVPDTDGIPGNYFLQFILDNEAASPHGTQPKEYQFTVLESLKFNKTEFFYSSEDSVSESLEANVAGGGTTKYKIVDDSQLAEAGLKLELSGNQETLTLKALNPSGKINVHNETKVYTFTVKASNNYQQGADSLVQEFTVTVYPHPVIKKFALRYNGGSTSYPGVIEHNEQGQDHNIFVILPSGSDLDKLIVDEAALVTSPLFSTDPVLSQVTLTPNWDEVQDYNSSNPKPYTIATEAQNSDQTYNVHVFAEPEVTNVAVGNLPFAVVGKDYTYKIDLNETVGGTTTLSLKESGLGLSVSWDSPKYVLSGKPTVTGPLALTLVVTTEINYGGNKTYVFKDEVPFTLQVLEQPRVDSVKLDDGAPNFAYIHHPTNSDHDDGEIVLAVPAAYDLSAPKGKVGITATPNNFPDPGYAADPQAVVFSSNDFTLNGDSDDEAVELSIAGVSINTSPVRKEVTAEYRTTLYRIPDVAEAEKTLPSGVSGYEYSHQVPYIDTGINSVKFYPANTNDSVLLTVLGLELNTNGTLSTIPSKVLKEVESTTEYTIQVRVQNTTLVNKLSSLGYSNASTVGSTVVDLKLTVYPTAVIDEFVIELKEANGGKYAGKIDHKEKEIVVAIPYNPQNPNPDLTELVPIVKPVPTGIVDYSPKGPKDFSNADTIPVDYKLMLGSHELETYKVYVGILPGTADITFPAAIEGKPYDETLPYYGGSGTTTPAISGSLPSGFLNYDNNNKTYTIDGTFSNSHVSESPYSITLSLNNEISQKANVEIAQTYRIEVLSRPLVDFKLDLEGVTIVEHNDPVDYNDTGSIVVALPYSQYEQLTQPGNLVGPQVTAKPSGAVISPVNWDYRNGQPNVLTASLNSPTDIPKYTATSKYEVVFYIIPEVELELPAVTAGVPYHQPLTFSDEPGFADIVVSAAGLPGGLNLEQTAGGYVIAGTPTQAGTYGVTVNAENRKLHDDYPADSDQYKKELTLTLVVYPDPEILLFGFDNQVSSTIDQSSGEILVVLQGGNGRESLTPTVVTTYGADWSPKGAQDFTQTVSYRVSTELSASSYPASNDYAVTVEIAPHITTEKVLPQGRTNKDYGPLPIEATGTGTITFEKGSSFPSDFDLTADGILTGKTSASGTYNFTVKAKSEFGEHEQEFELEILAAPEIYTEELTEGYLLIQYSDQVEAYGDPSTFSVVSGNLPNGLTLASDGTITGVPERSGLYSFTVRATNHAGTDDRTYYVRVYEGPRITKDLPEYMEVGESVPEIVLEVATSADPGTVTWQWYYNGDPIDGETTDTLVLQPPREGYYHVVLTSTINGMSTQSRICHLVIIPDRNGQIIVEVNDLEGPSTNIVNIPEVIGGLVSEQEMHDVTYNEAIVHITLKLQQLIGSQVPDEDRARIESYTTNVNIWSFMYMDITLTKNVKVGPSEQETELHNPDARIGMRMELPVTRRDNATYGLIHMLPNYTLFDKDVGSEYSHMTVYAYHFSTYAMAYRTSGSSGGGGGGSGGKNEPDTSDTFYTVTYLANLDEYPGNPVIATAKYAVRGTVRVTSKIPECEGYVFTGWNTEADGSGKTYQAGGTFTITEDTTLYAQWEEDAIMAVLLQEPPGKEYTGNPSTGSYPMGRMTYSATLDPVVDTPASGGWQSFLRQNALGASISAVGLLVLFWLRRRREEEEEYSNK